MQVTQRCDEHQTSPARPSRWSQHSLRRSSCSTNIRASHSSAHRIATLIGHRQMQLMATRCEREAQLVKHASVPPWVRKSQASDRDRAHDDLVILRTNTAFAPWIASLSAGDMMTT